VYLGKCGFAAAQHLKLPIGLQYHYLDSSRFDTSLIEFGLLLVRRIDRQ